MNKIIVALLLIVVLSGHAFADKPKYTRIYNRYGYKVGGTRTQYGVKSYYNRSGTVLYRERVK